MLVPELTQVGDMDALGQREGVEPRTALRQVPKGIIRQRVALRGIQCLEAWQALQSCEAHISDVFAPASPGQSAIGQRGKWGGTSQGTVVCIVCNAGHAHKGHV